MITHFGEYLKDSKPMKLHNQIQSYEKFSSFFKVFLLEHSSERMKIPSAFITRVGLVFPEMVILRSSPGKIWHVNIIKAESDVYFGEGWRKFVEDNSVEHRDILVFKYNGGYALDFKLFGKSECEKKEELEVEMLIEEEDEDEEEEYCDDESDNDYDYHQEEEDNTTEEETNEVEEEEDNDEEEEKSSRKRRGEFKANVPLKVGSSSISSNGGNFSENIGVKTVLIDEPEPEPEPEPEVTGHTHLRNPHFFTIVRLWMEHLLLVPQGWMNDHDIKLEGKVTFIGPQGRQWYGTVLQWTDGRIWIDGWGDFCRANNLRWKDRCICELLPDRMGNVLQVHVVRN